MFEVLQFGFMNRAIVAGLIVGIICPAIGIFIVLKRLSIVGDSLAHISLAGVAAGLISGIYPVITASVFAVLGALAIERLRAAYRNYSELAIGIMLSGGMAVGVILISLGNGFTVDVFSYLFGSIIATSVRDLWVMLVVGIIIVAVVGLLFKELFSIAFDEEAARLSGIPVVIVNASFAVITALTIVTAMRTVGILLVSSLIILPVAASLKVAKSFRQAFWLSIVFAESSTLIGILGSYYLDVAPGGAIILVAILILCMVLVTKRLQFGKGLS